MIQVTGATGNVGRGLVSELVIAAVATRAMTHPPDSSDFPIGMERVRGD